MLRDNYLIGHAAYRERRWDDAIEAFDVALEAVAGDGPAVAMIDRIKGLRATRHRRTGTGRGTSINNRELRPAVLQTLIAAIAEGGVCRLTQP